mmetsp:Transcript_57362/g.134491  ORF Transcript_57362/g.134491 Transcript_57362/m.134491 type:complete len:503 (-) Transcript_57362:38-1546(-)
MAFIPMRMLLLVGHWLAVAALGTRLLSDRSRHVAAEKQASSIGGAYDYLHQGQDWVQGSCASRSRQSPVDLTLSSASPTAQFLYLYTPLQSQFAIYNNGHTISADLAGLGGGGISMDGSWYNLMNVNVHAASEHTFDGVQKPLELHLVHKRHDNDQLLIVAVLFDSQGSPTFLQGDMEQAPLGYLPPPDTDPNFNPSVQALLSVPPPASGGKVISTPTPGAPLDLPALLSGGTFVEYAGSTTAPPCAEVVTWLVRREALSVSDAQAQRFHSIIYSANLGLGNFRSVMPMNGRTTVIRNAVAEVASPQTQVSDTPDGSDPPGREHRALQWAKDALRISKEAVDYVKDLDQRELAAARARMEIFKPLTATTTALAPGPAPIMAASSAAAVPAITPGHVDLQATVRSMAGLISHAANEAVANAVHQISVEARSAAFSAAKEAAEAAHAQAAGYAAPAPRSQAPSPAPLALAAARASRPSALPAAETPSWITAMAPAGWVQARIAN